MQHAEVAIDGETGEDFNEDTSGSFWMDCLKLIWGACDVYVICDPNESPNNDF